MTTPTGLNMVTPTSLRVEISGIELIALKKLALITHALATKFNLGAREEAECLAKVLDDVIRRFELASIANNAKESA